MPRKITVGISIRIDDMMMGGTDEALEIVRGVMAALGDQCQAEIKDALEDAGAQDVSISMVAY